MEDDATMPCLVDEVRKILTPERRVSTEKSVCDDAHRPHVDRLPVTALEHNLRGSVAEGTSHGLEHTLGRVEMFRNAKVSKDE